MAGEQPSATDRPSPMMQQYLDAKAASPDCLLLFKMGDFYEAFNDDALTLAKTIGLALTNRGDVPMAGFPQHQLESYLAKLLAAGQRVAVCEQVEKPTKAQRAAAERIVTRPIDAAEAS